MELVAPRPIVEPVEDAAARVGAQDSLASLSRPSTGGSARAADEVHEGETASSADEETRRSEDADPPSRTSRAQSTRRARAARVAAGLVLAAIAAFAAVAGGRRVGALASAEPDETVEGYLDAGRESLRKHAWDAPSPGNIQALTDRALARFPGEPRILELRREAAERMVSDALGRSYAGDRESARRIARLAIELHPRLTSAQHLLAELEAAMAVATATPAPPSTPSKQTAATPARSSPEPAPPLATSASAHQKPPRPGSTAQPASAAGPAPSAELPPKPNPSITPVSAPDPSSTPWL
jgi:serine/threonine-protein kinase